MRPCSLLMSQSRGDVNVFEWMQFTSLDRAREDVEMAYATRTMGYFPLFDVRLGNRFITTSVHYIFETEFLLIRPIICDQHKGILFFQRR